MVDRFRLSAVEIEPLAEGYGSCLASNRITIDGAQVGLMYREESGDKHDSGWRFLAGDENDAYTGDPSNFAIYDVNTIANYDRSIIPHLNGEFMIALERDPESGRWSRVPFPRSGLQ